MSELIAEVGIYLLIISVVLRVHTKNKNKKTDCKTEESARTQVTNDIRHITSRKKYRANEPNHP